MRFRIAMMGAVAVVLAAGAVAYAKAQVPFKLSGTAGIEESAVQGLIVEDGVLKLLVKNKIAGTATGTQLGKCTFEGTQLFTVPYPYQQGVAVEGYIVQTETYTAANGDELEVASEGPFLVMPTGANLLPIAGWEGSGTMEIVGGTGRFAGATGTGTFTVYVDDDLVTTYEDDGLISSVGSSGGNGKK